MLTEPVECKSCGAVSVNGGTIHCHTCFSKAFRAGFVHCLEMYGIWENGERKIGCMNKNIKDVIAEFDKENLSEKWAKEVTDYQDFSS